jgi:hypothetical protein
MEMDDFITTFLEGILDPSSCKKAKVGFVQQSLRNVTELTG